MKKTLVIALVFSMSFYAIGQEKTKIKEVGLVFRSMNSFGVTYKMGSDRSLWRFNTLFINGRQRNETNENYLRTYNSFGGSIKIGKEYHKEIFESLELRFGADLSFYFAQSESITDDNTIENDDRLYKSTYFSPGINLVLGLNYVINENLVIGAELLPIFSYYIQQSTSKNDGKEIKTERSSFRNSLSNTSVLLSLAYRY